MSATINPEWVKLLEQERDAYRVEYECRADWIAKMNAILGCDNSDGFHSEPDPFQIATELKRLADIGKRWETDSSLEKWFPFTAKELANTHDKLLEAELKLSVLAFWWMPRHADPIHAGWYYVREVQPRLKVGVRYFDDTEGTWWAVSKDGKNDGSLVPNESFHDWLTIPNISDRQRP